MNRKGFTLVELLAVIVVLALLVLIVSTSVTRIIKNSREDMYESQLVSIEKSAKIWGAENIDILPENGECKYITLGYLKQTGLLDSKVIDSRNNSSFNDDLKIKITSRINEYGNSVVNYEVGATDVTGCTLFPICMRATTLHKETCTQEDTSYYCSGAGYTVSNKGTTITYGSLGTSGKLTSGDAFDCDVNADGKYDSETERFYYVTDLDSNTAVLIYYNNTTKGIPDNTSSSLIAYNSSNINNLGPVTGIVNLPETSKWKGVSLKNSTRQIKNEINGTTTTAGDIVEFSYTGYSTRLLTYQEVVNACGNSTATSIGYLDNCNYLLENTKYSDSTLGAPGYWLETPSHANNYNIWFVYGNYRSLSNAYASSKSLTAVRPVIEAPKTNIVY